MARAASGDRFARIPARLRRPSGSHVRHTGLHRRATQRLRSRARNMSRAGRKDSRRVVALAKTGKSRRRSAPQCVNTPAEQNSPASHRPTPAGASDWTSDPSGACPDFGCDPSPSSHRQTRAPVRLGDRCLCESPAARTRAPWRSVPGAARRLTPARSQAIDRLPTHRNPDARARRRPRWRARSRRRRGARRPCRDRW